MYIPLFIVNKKNYNIIHVCKYVTVNYLSNNKDLNIYKAYLFLLITYLS